MSNEIYTKFLSTGFKELNTDSYRHIIKLYQHNYSRFLPVDKEAKILDIGCGMGQFLTFLGQSGYNNYLGVDIAPEAIAFCQEKGIGKVKQIDDLLAFLNTVELQDLIVLNDVIEHFAKVDILPILKLIKQRLTANGRLMIKTGNLASLVGPRIRYNDFTHEVGFTEYSLNQVLLVAGYNEVRLMPFAFPKNSPIRTIRFIGQKILHFCWKAVYFFEYTDQPKIVDELIVAVAQK